MTQKYTNALRVLREMLTQRGLAVTGLETTRLGTVLLTHQPHVVAVLVAGSLFNAVLIMNMLAWSRQRDITHMILVHSGSATHATKRIIDNHATMIRTELFTYSEMQINLTQHTLVPTHRKIDADERSTLVGRYAATYFPSLLTSDPVARFFYFQAGDMIEITRPDGVVAYRTVVAT